MNVTLNKENHMPAKKKAAKKKTACPAITAAGTKCKRLATPPAKYCSSHKGWKPPKKKVAKKKVAAKKKKSR